MKKTIYKKDSKGKIRILSIWTEGNKLNQESGLLEGKKILNSSFSYGKNIGKSNETTNEEQAILEGNSIIRDKLDKGYFETIEEAQNEEVLLPMLAKDYKKEFKKIQWGENVFIQPKLDGMRCIAIKHKGKVTLMSRAGKIIDTVPHIKKDLESIDFDFILDGELYVHGEDFQKNMTLIKKYRKGETEKVKYHFYDIIIKQLSFNERYMQNKNTSKFQLEHIQGVFTTKISDEEGLKTLHKQFISEGYEGSIIRWGNEEYKINGRSSNLLKYKDFIDRTGIIIDIIPSEKRPEQGVLLCKFKDKEKGDELINVSLDKTFKANLKMSHEDREYLLTNKNEYIGQTAELRFFEYTNDGLARFPVCVGIRLDK